MLFILLFALITYGAASLLLQKTKVSFSRLLFLGFVGLTSHFFLDMFTFHEGACSIWLNPALRAEGCVCPGPECSAVDDRQHLFFWPLWDFPPHINTILPFTWVTYEVRVWVEVIYTISIGLILLYLLLIKRENIFGVFNPRCWWKYGALDATSPPSNVPIRLIIWEIGFFLVFGLQYLF